MKGLLQTIRGGLAFQILWARPPGKGSGLSWSLPVGQWEAVLDLGPATLQLWCFSWAPLLFKP